MSLEEQLRNDAQSLREVGWFNRAIMMDAAANEIQKLNERIKRLEEVGDDLHDGWRGNRNNKDKYLWAWHKAKEANPCIKQLKTKSCIYCMKVECECSDFDVSADMGAKG